MSKEKSKKIDPLLGGDPGEEIETPQNKKPAEKGKEPEAPMGSGKVNDPTVKRNNDIVAHTKAILAKQPKLAMIIPLGPGEKAGAAETVQINGYRLTIQKGVRIDLPEAVANLIAEKYKIQMTAGQDKRLDRNQDVQDTLG